MRNAIVICLVLVLCGAASAEIVTEFDQTISDVTGYEILTVNLNNKSLLVTGAGTDRINADGGSYVEVWDTSPLEHNVGGIYSFDLDDSVLDFRNGELGGIRVIGDATATFSGGRIDYISSYQDSDIIKHITFVCDVDSVDLTGDLLTGDWLDGKGSFSITLQDQNPVLYDSVYSNISFVVPEPASIALLGLGVTFLRKRK